MFVTILNICNKGMITYLKGNLFESPAQVLVNTVNTVGVMGKGIARTFKQIYPEMFREYQILCESINRDGTRKFNTGNLWLYKTTHKWILNFPTKEHWRSPSRAEYIEEGLKTLVKIYQEAGISTIAFPPLGCGNGELNWEKDVKPLMEKYLSKEPIDVFVYFYDAENIGQPEHKNIDNIKKWLRSEPISLPFFEVFEDINEILMKNDFKVPDLVNNRNNYFIFKPIKIPDIYIDESKDAFLILDSRESNQGIGVIDSKLLQAVWNLLRDFGYYSKNLIPEVNDNLNNAIISLLLHLNYCETVSLIGGNKSSETCSKGVKITAGYFTIAKPDNGELIFKNAG